MEVVPTGDGDDDDGVIWFRCPQCQGFLPKLGGDLQPSAESGEDDSSPAVTPAAADDADDEMPWDSPAAMMAARQSGETVVDDDETDADGQDDEDAAGLEADDDVADDDVADDEDEDDEVAGEGRGGKDDAPVEPAEPIAEYAAMLAALDPSTATPYRPSGRYDVGQCIHHLAWEDCGVVVAHETLPGGRRVIKCWFESAGVVRLIVEAPE
jgi:hypothetical protein